MSNHISELKVLLHKVLSEKFNLNELHDLAFQLTIDVENLNSATKNDLVKSIIEHQFHRDNEKELIQLIEKLRPRADDISQIKAIYFSIKFKRTQSKLNILNIDNDHLVEIFKQEQSDLTLSQIEKIISILIPERKLTKEFKIFGVTVFEIHTITKERFLLSIPLIKFAQIGLGILFLFPVLFFVLRQFDFGQIADEPFQYVVKIQNDSGAPIQNAKVTIEVSGKIPIIEYSDSNGVVTLPISSLYINTIGRITVEASGYQVSTNNITIVSGQLPGQIRLIALPPTPTASATFTPTPTVTPSLTNTPSPTPTTTLTSTPTPKLISADRQTIVEAESFGNKDAENDRSNASNLIAALMNEEDRLSVPFQLEQAADFNLRIRYSNDTAGDVIEETDEALENISVTINGQEIGQFTASDTGSGGEGWNTFRMSPIIHTSELTEGFHNLGLQIIGGDGIGVEIDAIVFVPVPYAYIVEDFEGERRVDWWTDQGDTGVYSYAETDSLSNSGQYAFSIEYNKANTFQALRANLPNIARDLSNVSQVEFWVYGKVCILLKLQDEDFAEADVSEQCSEVDNDWEKLEFTLTPANLPIDLTHIENMLFFFEPGNEFANGAVIIDDLLIK